MARILPWVERTTPQSKTPKPRRKRSESASEDERKASVKAKFVSSPAQTLRQKRAPSRTPSLSPPPRPPPVEFMRNGYEQDDIYIMVEDEFQAIAQSYTRHLHHAEYKRLQKKARDAPAKALPTATSSMMIGTRQKLEAKSLREQQDGALKQMTNGVQTSSTNNVDDIEEQADDPWSGTYLAGLMQTSSQQKTALVGLENISSSTRAAQGFTRNEGNSSEKPKQAKTILEIFGGKKEKPQPATAGRGSGVEDDDHDGHPLGRNLLSCRARPERCHDEAPNHSDRAQLLKRRKTSLSETGTASRRSTTVVEARSGFKTAAAPFVFDDGFDDFDDGHKEDTKPGARQHTGFDPSEKRKLVKERERKMKMSEIPLFLG